MSKIMVLPGTKWQIPLIEKIKDLGHEVYLVNPSKNREVYEQANHFLCSDIFQLDDIENYAKKHSIDAVISDQCDIAMPVVAELGKRLGLSALSVEAASLYTNKYFMHCFCEKSGVKTAEYCLCRAKEEAIDFLHKLGKPIIIKPIDSNASHGVFRVETEQDIRNHFDETMSFSRSDNAVLAERYIAGTEFTIDGIKTPNQHYTLAISEKKHYAYNEFIANELFFMHSNDRFDYEHLKSINNQFVMNSPLLFGLTHAEYKYENGKFYLIEIGSRGGGNMISSIITQHMSGLDTYEYLINCSLGKVEPLNFELSEAYKNRAAVLRFFDAPNEGKRVKEILGIDFFEKENDIKDYSINFSKGDVLKNAKNDSERIGYYIACSDNREKLKSIMNQVDDHFKILIQ